MVCAAAASAQSFDIKTVDPESVRAIAVKITDAQRPAIDGKLTDEAWALATPQDTSMSYSSDRTRHVYGTLGGDFGGYYNGDRQSLRANVTISCPIALARRQDDVLAGSIALLSIRRASTGPQLPQSYS